MGFLQTLGEIGNAIGGFFSMGIDLANYNAQKEQQAWEREQYEENRDYQRALQQEIFNREDTALQRGVKDAKAAGLSPLVASGASSGSVVSISDAPQSNAPELDLDPIAAMQAAEELKGMASRRKLSERQQDLQEDIHEDNVRLKEEELEEQKRHNKEMEINQSGVLAENKRQFDKQLENQVEQWKEEYSLKTFTALTNNAREDIKIKMQQELHKEQITEAELNNLLKVYDVCESAVRAYYAEQITVAELRSKLLSNMEKEINNFEEGKLKRYLDKMRETGPFGSGMADIIEGTIGLGEGVFGTFGSIFSGGK